MGSIQSRCQICYCYCDSLVQVLQIFNSFSIHGLPYSYVTPQEEVNRVSVRISWGHGMRPSFPIDLTACHTYSVAHIEMQNNVTMLLMPVSYIALPSTSKFDMFCHSLLLSPLFHIVWVFFKHWSSFLGTCIWNIQKLYSLYGFYIPVYHYILQRYKTSRNCILH